MKKNNTTVPIAIYTNADLQKNQILEENRGKSGIYCLKNLLSGKTYIGSSVDLGRRLRNYFNINYLARNETMYICRSLLLHGYSNFSLEILEYCDPSLLLEREKWYFELLKPEYNLAKEPGSPMLDRNHSEEAKTLISEARKGENHPLFGQNHSEETKGKISEALKGKNNPMFGKTHSEETRLKIIEALKGNNNFEKIKVLVTDLETNISTTYDSIHETARALNILQSRITKYFTRNQQKPFKGRYVFRKIK